MGRQSAHPTSLYVSAHTVDIHSFWIVALSIATPVAGVVGFAIQLRQVKRTRLENEKLLLEITALKERAATTKQRIVKPTTEEVLKVNHGRTMFSRRPCVESRCQSHDKASEQLSHSYLKAPFKEKAFAALA